MVRPDSQDDNAVRFHDKLATAWEQKYADQSRAFAARLKVLSERLPAGDLEGKRWLDAGCGTGTLSRYLAERGAAIIGVDASAQMIEEAKRLLGDSDCASRVSFSVAPIDRLPSPDESFDGALCSSVLEYLSDPESALRELRRVVRVGGRLLVSVPNAQSMLRRILKAGLAVSSAFGRPMPAYLEFSRNEYTIQEFEGVLSRSGWKMDGNWYFGATLPGFSGRYGNALVMFSASAR